MSKTKHKSENEDEDNEIYEEIAEEVRPSVAKLNAPDCNSDSERIVEDKKESSRSKNGRRLRVKQEGRKRSSDRDRGSNRGEVNVEDIGFKLTDRQARN